MKQLELLERKLKELKGDTSILGVMLMGSVAYGTATEASDLDIFVLCDRDRFEAEFTDGILVECIYMKYETASYKLKNNAMEVYHYINSKILYDNGQLQDLMSIAYKRFNHYKSGNETKKGIYHWLVSVKVKLQSAWDKNDVLRMNYLTATNSWKLIEAIWAVNNRPMPPSSSVTRFMNEIVLTPDERWFDKLFSGSDNDRTRNMLAYIDWVLPLLI